MNRRLTPRLLALAVAIPLAAGCAADQSGTPAQPTAPRVSASRQPGAVDPAPTGERLVGQAAIEPAYNADSGDLMYLLTPIHAPLPSHANHNATSPLYIVEYPPDGVPAGVTLNCAGMPGNCPDHDGNLARAAMFLEPTVYGADTLAVPGHDHIGDPPGKPDFSIAWEVWVVAFTPEGVAHYGLANLPHLTTDTAIKDAYNAGWVTWQDLGFAFNCSVVSPAVYWKAAPHQNS